MYRAFGLTIDSDLPLPELAGGGEGEADVVIRRHAGPAPDRRDDAGYWLFPESDPFAYRVADGRRIDIWAPDEAAREDISIWLLGTVMAALLHQRGRLTVHANCLESPGGSVIGLAGDSGSGKSSIAALAAAATWNVLGDDLLAIASTGEVDPGVLRLKLWRDDLALLGLEAEDLRKVASDLDKYHVPLAPVADRTRRLQRLYLLGDGPLAFERLEGAAAAQALLANLYRFEVGQMVRSDAGTQFEDALKLAGSIEVWRFSRPRDRSSIPAHFEALEAHLEG